MAPVPVDPDFLSATSISPFLTASILVMAISAILVSLSVCACCKQGGSRSEQKQAAEGGQLSSSAAHDAGQAGQAQEQASNVGGSDRTTGKSAGSAGLSPPPQVIAMDNRDSGSFDTNQDDDVDLGIDVPKQRAPSFTLISPKGAVSTQDGFDFFA